MITRNLYRSLDERLGTTPVARKALAKVFPDHWSFMLGEIALYAFVALVLTGVYLTFFFHASTAETIYQGAYQPLSGSHVSSAFASTVALSFDVRAGLLIRQAHHWAALLFTGAIVLHLMRIFFTGAFRRPREINWLIGVTMLALALLNGFTGYSMPDDLLSGTGLRIIYSVMLSVPLVGGWITMLLFGGEFPSDQLAPRLFVAHVLLVPAALVALITVHLAIIVRQKHTHFPGKGRRDRNVVGSRFWPGYVLRSVSLLTAVFAVAFALGGLVQINPVWIYGPYHPAKVTSPAQPDWYVAWGDGALRLFPPVEIHIFGHLIPAPFVPGVGLGTVAFLLLYAWPWLERWRTGDRAFHHVLDRPRDRPGRVAAGAWALTFFAVLLVAAADDIIARFTRIPIMELVFALRILVLALPFPVAAVAFVIARALRAGGAATIGDLTRADLRAGLSRAALSGAAPQEGPLLPPRDEVVQVWRNPDGTWRWRWRGREAELTSNESYPGRAQALAAARTAFAGVRLERIDPPAGGAAPKRDRCTEPTRLEAAAGWLALYLLGRRRRRPRHLSGRR